MKLVLNDLNYLDWQEEATSFLKIQSLQKHIVYSTFELYFASLPKPKLEKADEKRAEVNKSWKREKRKFLSDELMKKWKEGEETAKGYIEKYIEKSFKREIKELKTAYAMWERLKELGEENSAKTIKKCDQCKEGIISDHAPPKSKVCKKCYLKNRAKDRAKESDQRNQKKEKTNNTRESRKKSKRRNSSTSDTKSCLIEIEPKEKREKDKKIFVNNSETARKKEKSDTWYLDSGCTAHLTNQRKIIKNAKKTDTRISGPLSNAKASQATILGEVNLKIKNEENEINNFELKRVICDENLRRNLMSVRKLAKEGLSTVFVGDKCYVIDAMPIFVI